MSAQNSKGGTSPKDGKYSSQLLRSNTTSAKVKSVAGSDLAQRPRTGGSTGGKKK